MRAHQFTFARSRSNGVKIEILAMNNIIQITRRNIFDSLRLEKIDWHGRLVETEFLSRIYDLSKMPSHDDRFGNMAGDIWQHRVNNYDWDSDWIFFDER
jgi:hypothetical protein